MAFELSRIDRLNRTYDLATVLPGGIPTGVTGVAVALLPPRSGPSAATVWFAATYAAGSFTVLFAGPDADSSGALVVPASADLWVKVDASPQVDAARIERITVLGGGMVIAPGPLPQVLSVQGRTGSVVLAATDVGAATPADLSAGLATKVNSSTYTTGLATKADATDARLSDQRVPTDGSVTNAKVSSSAAISADKLADGTTNKVLTATERTKLTGIAAGATANATDAQLRDRSTHTGAQATSTVTGLDAALTAKQDVATLAADVATAITKVTDPWLDVRARGATGTNPTVDTAAIQQAFTDVRAAGGGTVLIPKIYTTNAPLILAGSGVHVVGNSRENCGIVNSTTDVIQLGDATTSFAQSSIERLKLRALTGGGHVFIQGRNTSQSDFLQLDMYQDNDAKSIFESAGINLLETFWRSCFAQHRLTATVPGWNLVASNGGLNRNTWQGMRVLNSGNYMWHVEETSANYARDNVWRDINAEICNGGVIRLYSPRGGTIEHVSCYDLTTTTKDLFVVSKSTGNIGFARFRDIHRPPGGALGAGLVDLRIANSSLTVIDGWTNGTLDLAFSRAVLRDLDAVTLQNAGNVVEYYNRGPVYRSPDGTRYIVTVANGGAISTIVAP